jgi:hypothetical protein
LILEKEGQMKKCIYCGIELSRESVIDFCDKCGTAAFGSKMFKTIVENMQQAESRGDLEQGAVS